MMYGRKPFGEGKSQERVLSEGIMLKATQVEFPSDTGTNSAKVPRVSDEANDVIRACLSPNQQFRPDVATLCQMPYLRNNK